MFDLTPYLNTVISGHDLTEDDSFTVFSAMISGDVEAVPLAGFLSALATKGESVAELTGAVQAMRAKSTKIDAPKNAIDCCGTGGDCTGSLNISTATSFVVAGCGVPMAKHGNRSASSKSGAADVLEALGVNLNASPAVMTDILEQHNICFMMAPNFHPATKHVVPVRKALKIRTIFNLLGPLLNPANTKRQLIGVFDPKWAEPMAQVLHNLGSEFVWIVHGSDGLDEITVTGKTHITELNEKGHIRHFDIHPHDVGLNTYDLADIKGGDAEHNAHALRQVLNGQAGGYLDIVLMNSAAALLVAGKVQNLKDGIDLAQRSIDTGAALNCLNKLAELSHDV